MKQQQITHLTTLVQFSIVYSLIYMILEMLLLKAGWDWWLYGIIFILVGILMYALVDKGWIVDYLADYLIYVGTSFILYDIVDVLIMFGAT